MTTLISPGRLEQDADLPPVPWRRMAWVIWRQHRFALIGVTALLGGLAVCLWIVGLRLHHAYAAAIACHPASSPACTELIDRFNSMDDFLANGFILQAVPALIGAFVGAPVLARELETGTFRYAWTQGFGRWRWTLAKLVTLAVMVTTAAGALSVVFSWYYQPYFATGNQALTLRESSPLAGGLFNLHGLTFAAWTLAAFAIGASAGLLTRRVVPAMVATLAVYAGIAFMAGMYLRQHYLTPLITHHPNLPASAYTTSQWWTKDGRFAFGSRPPLNLLQLHALDQLPASQPVLAIPVDRGRLVASAVGAAHRRDRLDGPPPGGLNRLALTVPANCDTMATRPGRHDPAGISDLSHEQRNPVR